MNKLLDVALWGGLLSILISVGSSQPTSGPTLIFFNGQVITLEADQPQAQALAVQGDKILAVGSNDEILALKGSSTRLIDLQGRSLLPGFIDDHTHLFNESAERLQGFDMEVAQQLALKNGWTTMHNLFVSPRFLQQITDFERAGKLRVRINLYLNYADACGKIANPGGRLGDWYKQYPPTQDLSRKLRIAGVKLYVDGGACGEPALSFPYPPPYSRQPGDQGDLWFTQEQLNQIIEEIHQAGYSIVAHAFGDRGIEQMIKALEFALAGQANEKFRHRITHNAILRPDLLEREKTLGVLSSVEAMYNTSCAEQQQRGWGNILGSERRSWLHPLRAQLDAGLHVAAHTDFPFTRLSPLLGLYSLVTRKGILEDGVSLCEPPDWLAANRVKPEEALRMLTIEGAYTAREDGVKGSLKPGKLADLVVLSDNPLTVRPDGLKDLQVLMTVVGGQIEYQCTQPGIVKRALETTEYKILFEQDVLLRLEQVKEPLEAWGVKVTVTAIVNGQPQTIESTVNIWMAWRQLLGKGSRDIKLGGPFDSIQVKGVEVQYQGCVS